MVHESMTSLTDFYTSNSCLAHTPDHPRPVTLGTDPPFKASGVWTDLWEALKAFVPVTSSLRITYFELCTHSPACQNDTARIDPGDILAHTGCRFYGVAAAQAAASQGRQRSWEGTTTRSAWATSASRSRTTCAFASRSL